MASNKMKSTPVTPKRQVTPVSRSRPFTQIAVTPLLIIKKTRYYTKKTRSSPLKKATPTKSIDNIDIKEYIPKLLEEQVNKLFTDKIRDHLAIYISEAVSDPINKLITDNREHHAKMEDNLGRMTTTVNKAVSDLIGQGKVREIK